jgi:hypothetical protein
MIQIETMWLYEALEDHSGTVYFYLDKQTGEILRISEMSATQEEQQEIYDQVESEPDRWVPIEPLPSRDEFEVMEDFVVKLPDGEDKRTLEHALSYKKPFSNFKQALSGMPDLRKQWFVLHDNHTREAAEALLKDQGIEAKLK